MLCSLLEISKNINIKHYRNKIRTLVRCSKKLYYHSYFNDHMKNVRKTWIEINHLIGRNKRRRKRVVALPNVLNEFFTSVGQKLAASVPPANHDFSDYLPADNSPSSFFFEPVTSMELETKILLLPTNKSHMSTQQAFLDIVYSIQSNMDNKLFTCGIASFHRHATKK